MHPGCGENETMSDSGIHFISAARFRGSRTVPRHSHDGVELVMVTEGSCRCRFPGGITLDASAGDVYIQPPQLEHSQFNFGVCETNYVIASIRSPEFDISLRLVHTGGDPAMRELFRALCCFGSARGGSAASAATEALWLRLRELTSGGEECGGRHPALRRAMELIEREYASALTVDQLARHAGIGASRLNQLFKEQCGRTPIQYLLALRLKHAAGHLRNPYWNISEIARLCGFENTNYFSRKFRAVYGITPGEFRRNALMASKK